MTERVGYLSLFKVTCQVQGKAKPDNVWKSLASLRAESMDEINYDENMTWLRGMGEPRCRSKIGTQLVASFEVGTIREISEPRPYAP